MPRTRRDKEISLTKVKKSRENKENLVEQIRECIAEYASVYSFNIENLRSSKFIQIRQKFKKTSKFFFGKRNVMALALGRTAGEEIVDGIHKVSKTLEGQCGLIFTNEKEKDFIKYFTTFDDEEFARSGNMATHSVHLPAGPLTQFPFSMEPQLKRLGLPCKVERGFVELYDSFQVCSEGDTLTADQCKILKLLGEKMATFKEMNNPSTRFFLKWTRLSSQAARPKSIEPRFSRSSAYYGADKLELRPSTPLYIPNYYDTDEFQNKRVLYAAISFAIFFAYFGYFREKNDIDQILNSEPHVLAGNLERKMLSDQIQEARRAGKPTDLLEAQLAYVDVKEAAIRATYDKRKKIMTDKE